MLSSNIFHGLDFDLSVKSLQNGFTFFFLNPYLVIGKITCKQLKTLTGQFHIYHNTLVFTQMF